jgi:hypothetical protein
MQTDDWYSFFKCCNEMWYYRTMILPPQHHVLCSESEPRARLFDDGGILGDGCGGGKKNKTSTRH